MFLSQDFHRISPAQSCQHGEKAYDSQVLPLLTMDSWMEFLDPPPQPSIVQAHQNWLARLAAASIAIQRGDVASILPHDPCWKCATMSFVSKQQLQKEQRLRDQEQQKIDSDL
jgi:hypothetical protein